MALHIFNLCVDTKDFELAGTPEDLSINDQESVVEIVLEHWLGIKNAIEEHDEPDQEDGGMLDFQKISFVYVQINPLKQPFINFQPENDCSEHSFVYTSNYVQMPYIDIISPPPEA